MNAFLRGYLETALWSSYTTSENGDMGPPLDESFDISDFSPEALREAEEDCASFERDNAADLEATGASDGRNGHDFWLTRNRHGAGFWDRGYGEVGERLTKAAHVYGSVDLYKGDDGMIHS